MMRTAFAAIVQDAPGDWWDIGSFWISLIALIVSVIVGTGAIWVTYRVSYPRRRLVILTGEATPLEADNWLKPTLLVSGLRRVRQPHLIQVTFGNDGRRSIPGSLFDQSRPFVVDFGAPVLFVGQETKSALRRGRLKDTEPALSPGVQVSGSEVRVGPGLLAPLQKVDVVVLVEGKPVVQYRNPLVDIPLADSRVLRRSRARFEQAWRAATLGVAAVALVVPLALDVRLALLIPLMALGVASLVASAMSLRVARRLVGPMLVYS